MATSTPPAFLASPTSATSPTFPSRYFPSTNACHCLNIQLSITPLPSPTPPSASSLTSHFSSPSSPFSPHPSLLATLESKSIQLEALTLVKALPPLPIPSSSQTPSSSWILFRCLGCSTDCFALEDSPATSPPLCVLNLDLATDTDIVSLQASPSYSLAFNVCIPYPSSLSLADATLTPRLNSSPPASASSAVGPGSTLSPSPSATSDSLRSSLDHSIDAERVAMQMRINQFVAEEQHRFALYERRGRKELLQLLSFLAEDRGSSPHPTPSSPALSRSRSPSVSPRPSLPSSPIPPPTTFQPLSTFLRRPSRQSPRLQRLLMDGLHHSSPLSPTDTSDDGPSNPHDDDAADDGTPTTTTRLPSLSSSAPRTPMPLHPSRMSPRQSIVLPVPQLSAMMRRKSREQEEEDANEAEMERSQQMILKWREQEEREKEQERLADAAVAQARRSSTGKKSRGRLGRGRGAATTEGEEDNNVQEIFYLDDTTPAEDSWTDMLVDGATSSSSRRSPGPRSDPDVLVITTDAVDGAVAHPSDLSSEDGAADGEEEKEEEEDGEAEDEDEGALSDDEAVAKTTQADILAMARRTSIPILSSSTVRAAQSRQLEMVPSSLPIPIPAALRQLVSKADSPSTASSHSSAASSQKPTPTSTSAAASTSVDPSKRRSSLHALAAERRPYIPPATHTPNPRHAATSATTPILEHLAQRSLSPEPTSPNPATHATAEPFMPPHTMSQEPFFSFSKYRHLEGVKGGGGGGGGRMGSSMGGGGGWGGMLSSSVPSSRGVMSGMLFRKEESDRRRAGGVSGLSVALGRKDLTDVRSSGGGNL